MTTTLTEVPKFENADTVIPASGEPRTVASISPALQRLADRSKFLRGAVWGVMVGGDVFGVDPGGTSTVFVVRVSAFESLVARDTNNVFWPKFTTADTTFTVADIEGAPGALANSSWYYAYIGANTDGSLRKQLSLTAPGASGVWKSSGTDQWRYMGCFPTTAAGAPVSLRAVGGRYDYDVDALAPGSILDAISAVSSSGVYAAQSLAAVVPPHVRNARVFVTLTTSAGAGSAFFRRTGATSNRRDWYTTAAGFTTFHAELNLNSSQQVDLQTNAGTSSVTAMVEGFSERR